MRPIDPKNPPSAVSSFRPVISSIRSVVSSLLSVATLRLTVRGRLRPEAMGALVMTLACLGAVITGCAPESRESAPLPETPPVYDAGVLERVAALSDSGYALMSVGEFDQALAVFQAQTALVPRGKWGLYNQACAQSRAGRLDKGLELLTQAVDTGWDDPWHMEGDPDLEPLRADPSFAGLMDRARTNGERRLEWLKAGLPSAEPFPGIEDEESLQERVREGWQEIRRHRGVWHNWQQTTAQVMLAARGLETERALKAGDEEFDYPLERVRTLAGLASVYQPWGAISDGVDAEAAKVLAENPVGPRADEAHYLAGMAAYGRRLPQPGDESWVSETGHAIRRFDMIAKDSPWSHAVAAWRLWFDLGSAGESRETLYPRLREFQELHADDDRARNIAAAFFQDDLVSALWPLPFAAVDIDGKPVDLGQYKGKVLLLDFWATWCGPCRGELPHMKEAYQRFHKDGFEILSVSLDYEQNTSMDDYRAWVENEGMVWRHVYDMKNWGSPLVQDFFVTGIPSPFLIGRDGKLAASGEALRGENLAGTIAATL